MKILSWFFLLFGSLFSFVNPTFASEVQSVIILGGGMSGLTAAVYLGRAGYSPIILEGPLPGGDITKAYRVENWPGKEKISGLELSLDLKKQALANHTQFLEEEVVKVDFNSYPYEIFAKDLITNKMVVHKTYACIIAMGTEPRYLNIDLEKELLGKGISNCALCDGTLYKGKTVAVIGGGDNAIMQAEYLQKLVQKVYILIRSNSFTAKEKTRIDQLLEKSNIEVIYNVEVQKLIKDPVLDKLSQVVLKKLQDNQTYSLSIDGLFLAIGSIPRTSIFKGQLPLDEKGYVLLKDGQKTSKKGIFAAGDITDPPYKQAINASSSGAIAGIEASEFLQKIKNEQSSTKSNTKDVVTKEAIQEIDSEKEFDEVLKKESIVLADFYATWCPPCRQIAPLVHQIAEKMVDRVIFLKINVDKNNELVQKYQIQSMPTLCVFDKNHQLVSRIQGSQSIRNFLINLEKQNYETDLDSFIKNWEIR
jgi:thioredoxin reductase (NADPH)